jgi:hypothetical protein
MRRTVICATVGVMCLAAVAARAAAAAAPAPSTARAPAPAKSTTARAAVASTSPTSAPVDQSTPKGALKVLARALEAGDRKVLLELLDADSASERKIAEATAGLAEATAELRRASVTAFGETASRPLGVDGAAVADAMARVDASVEKIDGDTATVTSTLDPTDSMLLVQRDRKWRVPMAQISGAINAADLDKNLHDTTEQVKLLKALAGEVAGGKYKTAIEARQELDRRIIQSAMPQGAAATAPVGAKQ